MSNSATVVQVAGVSLRSCVTAKNITEITRKLEKKKIDVKMRKSVKELR